VFDTARRLIAGLVGDGDRQEGQGLAEYSLLLVLVAMVAIASLLFMGGNISVALNNIGDTVSSVIP